MDRHDAYRVAELKDRGTAPAPFELTVVPGVDCGLASPVYGPGIITRSSSFSPG